MIEISKISQLFPRKKGNQSKRLLAIFAHPDDESLQLGGLIAKAVSENISIHLLCLTKGERGIVNPLHRGEYLKKAREKELLKAGKILGIKNIMIHNFPDGGLIYRKKRLYEVIKKTMNDIRPEIVITHDPSGMTGHPDHIITSFVTKSVMSKYFIEKTKLLFVVYGKTLRQIIPKVSKRKISWELMPKPSFFLDVSRFNNLKEKACLSHQTQRLAKSKSVDITLWCRLFDKEYFHLVDLQRKYEFKFEKFKTNFFKFKPLLTRVLRA